MDMVANQAAKFYHMLAGRQRAHGGAHHMGGYIRGPEHPTSGARVAHVPGLKTVLPSTPTTPGLMFTALRDRTPDLHRARACCPRAWCPRRSTASFGQADIKKEGKT
jgi:pyruvate/2-oxoglutarate/acetoin dehydrogenase E1 component